MPPKKSVANLNDGFNLNTNNQNVGPYKSNQRGEWVKTNKEKDYKTKKYLDYLNENKARITVDPEKIIAFEYEKEQKMKQFMYQKMAALMLDPKDPKTQEEAYKIVPELETIPKRHFKEIATISIVINNLFRTGRMEGPDDFDIVLQVLSPDFSFPMNPLWDVDGVLIEEIKSEVEELQKDKKFALFNPMMNRFVDNNNEAYTEWKKKLNSKIKIKLAQRVFPALRDKTDDQIFSILQDIVQGKDPFQLWGANKQISDWNTSVFSTK